MPVWRRGLKPSDNPEIVREFETRLLLVVFPALCLFLFFLYYIFLFERSEFLIDTSQKKSLRVCRVHVCTLAIILVLVCRIMYHIRTYLISARLPRYVHPTLRTSVTLVLCIRTRDLPTCPSKASMNEAKRIATSTTTTHTRNNKHFDAAAVQQRRCPQL